MCCASYLHLIGYFHTDIVTLFSKSFGFSNIKKKKTDRDLHSPALLIRLNQKLALRELLLLFIIIIMIIITITIIIIIIIIFIFIIIFIINSNYY